MRLSNIAVITMAGLFSTVLISTPAQASCNVELPYEKLVDCIVGEAAGVSYNAAEEEDIDNC